MTIPERRVLVSFDRRELWLFLRPVDIGPVTIPGWSSWTPRPDHVDDSTVAIAVALALFCLPSGDGKGSRLLDWDSAVKLPWGVVLLLGGGFALAEATQGTGLADWIGSRLRGLAPSSPRLDPPARFRRQ